ncbi:MAG: 1-acyl-sn-glycerol-3-phosphate acyltransferase [Bifidobacteriaceae bacterium]|jgi:1-acyl-sn-glycerol-3-phosphate acyltransferase|nr:1-acyl-sn-glycerol-3-phosphate acyltransferase [Bifidobacteriaceae bacterium]
MNRTKDPQRVPQRWQAAWAHVVAFICDHVYLRTKVVGRANVPRRGPAILAGNHTGLVDGPVVLGAAPRGVHFIMKFSLGQGLGGAILRAAGQVPVSAAGGRQALRTCLELLERGQLVGVFPEGSRGNGRMEEIKAGVAWLAVNSGAPVIPFACLGTRRRGEAASKFPPPRRKLYIEFGPPLQLDLAGGVPRHDQIAAALEQIRQALADQVEAAVAASGIELPGDSGKGTVG